jgi:hypothetical protein
MEHVLADTFDALFFASFPLAVRRVLQRPLTIDDARRIVADLGSVLVFGAA